MSVWVCDGCYIALLWLDLPPSPPSPRSPVPARSILHLTSPPTASTRLPKFTIREVPGPRAGWGRGRGRGRACCAEARRVSEFWAVGLGFSRVGPVAVLWGPHPDSRLIRPDVWNRCWCHHLECSNVAIRYFWEPVGAFFAFFEPWFY